ncbi:MAG TPA: hypothetical protein VGC67_17350 [Cellulomonas sp.]
MSQTLATCNDPTLLIERRLQAAELLADQLHARAALLDSLADEMTRIDLAGVWQGAAGEQLLATTRTMAEHLSAAGDAHARAAGAMDSYAEEIRSARGRAGTAVDTWERGQRLTRLAALDHEQAIRRSAMHEPALTVPKLIDPGEPLREDAVTILAAAQRMDDQGGEDAAVRVGSAAERAPDGHSFWDDVGDVWSDVWHGGWDLGADIGNAIVSFGNTMSHHPDMAVELIGGLLLMGAGSAMEAGGIALNITGAGVMVVGAGMSLHAGLALSLESVGDDAIRPFEGSGGSESGGYRSPDAAPGRPPTSVTGYRDHASQRTVERDIGRWRVDDLIDNPPTAPVWQPDKQTWKFVGKDGLTVIVNDLGEIVTA